MREYSNRELYSPIPYEFLYVASSTPNLQITVNSIPALCVDCSYAYNLAVTPVVTSTSRSGRTLAISLSNPGSLTFALTDVTVTLLGVQCSGLTGTTASFTCTLPLNSDNSASLPAGSAVPKVHVAPIGYADASARTP